jgi:translation initiation factor 2B subunit (eIF-2B alpha/beta/delta family)
MPTHRGSSGRASLSSADQFRTIQESTKLCEQVLENVSRVISESKQNAIINEKMAQEWSEEIIALANANVAIDDAVSYAKRNLETFENDANNSTDRKAVVKKIKSDVLKLSKTDTSKSKFVTSIGRILQVCHCNIDIILWIAVIISY